MARKSKANSKPKETLKTPRNSAPPPPPPPPPKEDDVKSIPTMPSTKDPSQDDEGWILVKQPNNKATIHNSVFSKVQKNSVQLLYECQAPQCTNYGKKSCSHCHIGRYCSPECQKKHYPVHKELCNAIHDHSTEGLVGIVNLANTCYMSSALHLVSLTPFLREYLLSFNWRTHVNMDNPLGTNGVIVSTLAQLVSRLWTGSRGERGGRGERVVNPTSEIRKILSVMPLFDAFQQHDSQEFLQQLLDNLHEDVNQIMKKPYTTFECKKKGESDLDAAYRTLDTWQLRNLSPIGGIFTSLYKSLIKCDSCQHEQVTFEPFLFHTVVVPEKTDITVNMFIAPNQFGGRPFVRNIEVERSQGADFVLNVKEKVAALLKCSINEIRLFKVDPHQENKWAHAVPLKENDITPSSGRHGMSFQSKSLSRLGALHSLFQEEQYQISLMALQLTPSNTITPLFSSSAPDSSHEINTPGEVNTKEKFKEQGSEKQESKEPIQLVLCQVLKEEESRSFKWNRFLHQRKQHNYHDDSEEEESESDNHSEEEGNTTLSSRRQKGKSRSSKPNHQGIEGKSLDDDEKLTVVGFPQSLSVPQDISIENFYSLVNSLFERRLRDWLPEGECEEKTEKVKGSPSTVRNRRKREKRQEKQIRQSLTRLHLNEDSEHLPGEEEEDEESEAESNEALNDYDFTLGLMAAPKEPCLICSHVECRNCYLHVPFPTASATPATLLDSIIYYFHESFEDYSKRSYSESEHSPSVDTPASPSVESLEATRKSYNEEKAALNARLLKLLFEGALHFIAIYKKESSKNSLEWAKVLPNWYKKSLKTSASDRSEQDQEEGAITLNTLLHNNKKTEKLDTDNKWTCTECKETGGYRSHGVYSFNDMVMIYLMRFTSDGRKNNTTISIPLTINLSDYSEHSHTSQDMYAVNFVICHAGVARRGHYWCCYKRVNEKGEIDWYRLDDEMVVKCTAEVLSNAYIVVYSRVHPCYKIMDEEIKRQN